MCKLTYQLCIWAELSFYYSKNPSSGKLSMFTVLTGNYYMDNKKSLEY